MGFLQNRPQAALQKLLLSTAINSLFFFAGSIGANQSILSPPGSSVICLFSGARTRSFCRSVRWNVHGTVRSVIETDSRVDHRTEQIHCQIRHCDDRTDKYAESENHGVITVGNCIGKFSSDAGIEKIDSTTKLPVIRNAIAGRDR